MIKTPNLEQTVQHVKGEFETFGGLPNEHETGIEKQNSPLNCVSRKLFFRRSDKKNIFGAMKNQSNF